MKVLLATFAVFGVLPLSSRFGHQVPRATSPDSLVVTLTSTVPGREVEFSLVSASGAVHLVASRLSTHGDTVFATTPAQLTITRHLLTTAVHLVAGRGEPWLHAGVGPAPGVEVWGSELRITPGSRGVMLTAGVMRWRPDSLAALSPKPGGTQ